MSQPAAPANLNIRVFTQSGSKVDLTAPKSNFRFTPQSGLRADIAPCPFRANNGLLHRNKTRAQPITLSVRASTIGSVEPCYSIRIARRFIPLVL
jgi:hypothetical protein